MLLVEDGFPTVQANESDGRSTLVGSKGAQAGFHFAQYPSEAFPTGVWHRVPTGPLEDPLEVGPFQDVQEAASGTGDRL